MEKIILKKRICVGKDKKNGYNVYLDLNIKEVDDSQTETFRLDKNGKKYDISKGVIHQTIDHKKINRYKTLSICGDNREYGGQILDELTEEQVDFNVDIEIIEAIKKIWSEWHLNDLNPNCIHQVAFNCNCDDYKEKSDAETKRCPNGYRYGSAWLVKELPQQVIDEITSLFSQFKR